jgi:adenosylcobinamide kinase/adenosylcobinamide-phosphate guanylyltransferase
MLTVAIGGSGSGKSAYAESLLEAYKEHKYYIATMQVYDPEGERKVLRHRELRAGKGFVTIEQPREIGRAADQIERVEEKTCALLECMSNLVANEMFDPILPAAPNLPEKITADVLALTHKIDNLVVVTNNAFEDGITYDESTMEYLRVLGAVNRKLCKYADRVVEVVVGIPLVIKGEEQKCPS